MRRRTLIWLALLLWACTIAAYALRWALEAGRVPDGSGRTTFVGLGPTFLVGALGTSALAILFQAMHVGLVRRKKQATRSLGQLQVVATAIVLVVLTIAIMGDLSSALISVGLVGFGLTLALQRPLLALAGWATIFFGGMFREGDRIQVGELEGDVLSITLFTTRLWEIGSDRSPGRPTGRILSLSNAVFLEQPVANATSDTAVVFDEFVVNVAFEADLALARRLLLDVSKDILNPGRHEEMAKVYRRLTQGMQMEAVFPDQPFILMESRPSWMDLRLRYLVEARKAGAVQTRLTEAWAAAAGQHPEAIPAIYPRTQTMPIAGDGRPMHPVGPS